MVTSRFYCDHLVGLKRRQQYFKIYDFIYHKEKEKLPAVAILPKSINRLLIWGYSNQTYDFESEISRFYEMYWLMILIEV